MGDHLLVLLIDQYEKNRSMIRELYQNEIVILEAENLEEAWGKLHSREKIDLIICNWTIDGLSDDGFFTLLKKDKIVSHTPFIIYQQDECEQKTNEDQEKNKALFLDAVEWFSLSDSRAEIKSKINRVIHILQKLKNPFEKALESIHGSLAIVEIDQHWRLLYFNQLLCDLFGYGRNELQSLYGEQFETFIGLENSNKILADILDNHQCRLNYTRTIKKKNGETLEVKISANQLNEQDDDKLVFYLVFEDITEKQLMQRDIQESIRWLQYGIERDGLTGIYNRETFCRRAAEFMQQQPEKNYVVLYWDIERFKVVNDIFGMATGNFILKKMAKCLEILFGNRGIYGRLESDHFAACIPVEILDMEKIITKIREEMETIVIGFSVFVYMGVYYVENISLPVEQMCDRANLALKRIKGNYLQRYAVYDNQMREKLLEEQEIVSEMREALAQGQFYIQIQPIYDVYSEEMASGEVLVRWKHPVRGFIGPNIFIPIFEKNGFINMLDYYVWEEACRYLAQRRQEGKYIMPLSVNVSKIDLYRPDFCEQITGLVEKYDLPPEYIKLEITESAYTENQYQLLDIMERLGNKGFHFLMDDFGSGYSSLNVLKDLPVSVLKIDMRFLDNLTSSSRASNILTSVIRMAKWINMDVVAEGVENKEQLEYLRNIGCDFVQGYYYSKPVNQEDYGKMLDEKQKAQETNPTESVLETKNLADIWSITGKMNNLLNGLIGGIGIYELSGDALEVVMVNDDYYKLTGGLAKNPYDYRNNILSYLMPEEEHKVLKACYKAMEMDEVVPLTVCKYQQRGHLFWINLKIKYLGNIGERKLFYFIFNEIKEEQQRNQEEYHTATAKMNKILNLFEHLTMGIAVYVVDQEIKLDYCNKQVYEFLATFHHPMNTPHDLEQSDFGKGLKEKIREIYHYREEERSNIEYIMPKKQYDESILWLKTSISVIEENDATIAYITMIDVTKQLNYKKGYPQYHALYQLALEKSDMLVYYYDVVQDRLFFSELMDNGQRIEQTKEKYLKSLFHQIEQMEQEYRGKYMRIFNQISKRETNSSIELPVYSEEKNSYRWKKIFFNSIADQKGKICCVTGIAIDIQEEKELQILLNKEKKKLYQVQRMAERDGVTGILNRMTIEEKIVQYLDRNIWPAALFIYDLDNFKQVNDQYGHFEGDKLLRKVAEILSNNFRNDDLIGRIGGDEFVVLLCKSDNQAAIRQKAEITLQQIASIPEEYGWDIKITASLGIALVPKDGSTFTELYRKADNLLYEAKHKGKNCYVIQ